MCNSRDRVTEARNPVAPLGATAGAVSSEGEIMARKTQRPEKLTGPHHFTGITADAVTNVDFWCRVLGMRFVKNTLNFETTFRYHVLEDLGAWVPNVTGAARDFDWVRDTVNRLFAGVEGVERCWHFCLRAWGSRAEGVDEGRLRRGAAAVLGRRRRRLRARLRLPRDGRRRGPPRTAGATRWSTPGSSTCATSRSSSQSRWRRASAPCWTSSAPSG